MESLGSSSGSMMAVVGAPLRLLESTCGVISDSGHVIEIANDNSGDQVVLSGSADALTVEKKYYLTHAGIKCIDLRHSCQCQSCRPSVVSC